MSTPWSLGLTDRVVVVTGGGHGIGAAYCRALAASGARVVPLDLDGAAAHGIAKELEANGAQALGAAADVTDLGALTAVADAVVERWGVVHGLINNAAIFATIPMARGGYGTIDEREWDRMMAVNVKGTWLAVRAFVPAMRGYGKIVNISSATSLKGPAGRLHYVSSKAAILGMTKTLARELGGEGVRVNCIAPGSTLSEADPDERTRKQRAAAAQTRPLARIQTPEDLVGAALFFLSPLSDFITGQTLVVDGGAHMH
jgi:3-oxoacyl-[acyl-carrier protein] reductase